MSEKEGVFFFRKAQLPEGQALTMKEAEESLLRKLEERGGTCRKTIWQLARLCSMTGRQDEAMSYVQRLLQLSDDVEENAPYFLALGQLMMSNAYKNLSLCYQGKGDYVRAAKGFVLALKRNASDERPLKHLEELLEGHPEVLRDIPDLPGQMEMCRKAVEGARQAQPDFREHWKKLRMEQKGEESGGTAINRPIIVSTSVIPAGAKRRAGIQ